MLALSSPRWATITACTWISSALIKGWCKLRAWFRWSGKRSQAFKQREIRMISRNWKRRETYSRLRWMSASWEEAFIFIKRRGMILRVFTSRKSELHSLRSASRLLKARTKPRHLQQRSNRSRRRFKIHNQPSPNSPMLTNSASSISTRS